MFGFGNKKNKTPKTIESRLEQLARIGINLNPDAYIEDLLVSFSREEYETESSELLISMLGSEVETGTNAGAFFTDQLWSLDTECIEDHGDYAHIAMRLNDMFGDELLLTDIQDEISVDDEVASLDFESNNKSYYSKLAVDDDWLDPDVLKLFLQASKDAATQRVIGIGDPDGQTMMLCVLTPNQMKLLNSIAKTNFHPLTDSDF